MSERNMKGATRAAVIVVITFIVIGCIWLVMWHSPIGKIDFLISDKESVEVASSTIHVEPRLVIRHISTPESVKAIYITACTASEPKLRNKSLQLFEGTELNSIVIDLKDYTGTISYASTTIVQPTGTARRGCRIKDLPEFIAELHSRGLYTIARVTVFQDPLYANAHPELAIRRVSDNEKTWRDKNGLAYIDPGAVPFWDYIIQIAKEGYSIGFDEINFDYIRYPSDGDLTDMQSSWGAGRSKPQVLKDFFLYLREAMASSSAILSADLFGLTTSASTDMGIGQILENTLPYFDYVAPMVYPSHFAHGFIGLAKPSEHPYEVIKYSMDRASEKAIAASTTPLKLRPWLQDFDLGAVYTPAMIRAQIQATYDAGLTSWMFWNAASVYHKEAFMIAGASSTPPTSTASSTSTP